MVIGYRLTLAIGGSPLALKLGTWNRPSGQWNLEPAVRPVELGTGCLQPWNQERLSVIE
jgi:hypothetical protein